MMVVNTPVKNGTPRHSMFGRIARRHHLDHERHQPEQEIDHRLVGNEGDQRMTAKATTRRRQ